MSSKLKAEGSKQKSDPQINADYFFRLPSNPPMARIFRGSRLKAQSRQK
jgi:hypothetical protein